MQPCLICWEDKVPSILESCQICNKQVCHDCLERYKDTRCAFCRQIVISQDLKISYKMFCLYILLIIILSILSQIIIVK